MPPQLKDASIGIGASLASIGITFTQFEAGVRVAGSLTALAVAVLTIIKLVRDMRRP